MYLSGMTWTIPFLGTSGQMQKPNLSVAVFSDDGGYYAYCCSIVMVYLNSAIKKFFYRKGIIPVTFNPI